MMTVEQRNDRCFMRGRLECDASIRVGEVGIVKPGRPEAGDHPDRRAGL